MPTVSCDAELLFTSLGDASMSIEKFQDLCFDYGIELDEVTSEREIAYKEMLGTVGEKKKDLKKYSDKRILKIDVSANRYDLLCFEGLQRSLRVFLGLEAPAKYKTVTGPIQITVKKDTKLIRPFIVGAVLRNVRLDQASYESLIDLQDKLHSGICRYLRIFSFRRRTKVAIGTHDLDTLSYPFVYDALKPNQIQFIPLNQTERMDGNRLMEFYQADKKLGKFLHIIKDSPVYPVVLDSKNTVCSLPPIINGDHSKIKVSTRNIFIECTATEELKASTVLNMVVSMFSQYCQEKFSVEQVEVIYEADGSRKIYPDLSTRTMTAKTSYINSCIGDVKLSNDQIQKYLARMSLPSKLIKVDGQDAVEVEVPATRSDIMHACDIMEDVAVAYGINNIPKTVPNVSTVGAALPMNKLTDFIRREVALAGWSEVLPLILDENYTFLRKPDPGNEAVTLANPKTVEYQVVRTSLLPGIMKTLSANKKSPLPIRIFEASDITIQDPKEDRRARNTRHLCALYCGKASGFEFIHGLLCRVFSMLGVPLTDASSKEGYYLADANEPMLFEGRQASVIYNGKKIGYIGIVHPEVLNKFEVDYPCSVFEINIEPFV